MLHEITPDDALLIPAEQHAVRQDDGHDAVGLEVEQTMEQECVIRFGLGGDAVAREARVGLLAVRVPVLRIRRI